MAFENPGLIFSIPVPAASSCAGGLVLLHFGSLMNALAEETKKLARLQAVDLERARLTAALKALPGEIAQADSQLKAAQKRVTDADAGLKREELSRAALELEVGSLRAKAARFRTQLDGAQNSSQAQAFEHQIGFAEAEIGRLEDNELTSMENSEVLEAERVKARELAAKLTETLGLIRARVGEQDLEYREQLAALKTEREALRGEVSAFDDGVRLAHFDRIAGMRGTGLARAEGQQCSGCRMGIRPQVWNQLRDGVVLNCESCSRILYYDPGMEPDAPAKTAQSVRADLGGNSIKRKQAGV
jgi:predicted  nucleic acid-binding Zn-ribbon protein